VKTHNLHARGWIAIVALLALIAGHVALVGVIFRAHLSVAILAGVVGAVVLKYAFWKLRR
jgi:hypothetical protein